MTMDTMVIELTDRKAARLLDELEELNLIKICRCKIGEPPRTKLSDKYRGFLSREDGQQLNNHINQMRNEWNNF